MDVLKIFVPIVKVDAAKREVWGRAAQDVADKSGEVMDYPTSKPFFEEWSAEFERVTDGQSLGNVRAMHNKVAAGKLIAFNPNDAEKAFDIGTKIVDDQEWEKVVEGVYTGFSVGGSYVKKWKDGELTRYTANPLEISLVDSPCIPTARFSLVKADGTVEEKPFAAAEQTPAPDQRALAKQADAGRSSTAAIESAPAAAAGVEKKDGLKKGLYTVARLAMLLDEIEDLRASTQYETDWEGDMSPIPDELKAWCESGCAILRAMVDEETRELTGDKAEKMAAFKAAWEAKLAKAGARHSKADMEHVQSIHDHAAALGADCGDEAGKAAKAGDLQKREERIAKLEGGLKESIDQLKKATFDNETLKKVNEGLAARVIELEKTPAPAKVKLKVVEKAQDLGGRATDEKAGAPAADEVKKHDPQAALALMKKAQKEPMLVKV